MPGALSNIFAKEAVQGYVPYAQRDVIPVQNSSFEERFNVINFNHILKTGQVPTNTDDVYSVDWAAKDAFTRAIKTVEDNSFRRIRQDPELKELLAKRVWNHDDREAWEDKVSNIVSEEVDKIPGLQDYRTPSAANPLPVQNVRSLNALSADIEKGTSNIRFDCGVMSIVEGSVLQKADNTFLSASAGDGNYKKSASYFYATGTAVNAPDNAAPENRRLNSGHAFIVSSATGNIVEATSDPSQQMPSYKRTADDYTFEDFIRGEDFVATQNTAGLRVYDSQWVGDVATLQTSRDKLQMGDTSFEKFKLDDLRKTGTLDPVTHLEAESGNFLVHAANQPGGKDEVFIDVYQIANKGTPEEGYIRVSSGVHKSGEEIEYTDPLTQKAYTFTAERGSPKPEVEIEEQGRIFDTTLATTKRSLADRAEDFAASVANGIGNAWNAFVDYDEPEAAPARPAPVPAQPPRAQPAAPAQPAPNAQPNAVPAPAVNPPPAASNPIETLQKSLGVETNGKWDGNTNAAMAKLIAEVQLTPEYKNACKEIYGRDNGTPDLMPGPATIKAMKDRGMDPDLIKAMEDLRLADRSQSNDAYTVPDNAVAVIRQAQADQAAAAQTVSAAPGTGPNPSR